MNYYLKYDVIVAGAGVAGLSAAIALAEQGTKVLLVEKNGYLGGSATLGIPMLGFLDKNGRQVVGGIAQRFVDRLQAAGACYNHRRCPINNSVTVFHPDVFKIVALEFLEDVGVDILLNCEVVDVKIDDNQIKEMVLYGKCNKIYACATQYIDATGDGDLAFLAGCDYEKGQFNTGRLMPPTVMFSVGGFNEEEFLNYLTEHPEQMSYGDRVEGNGYNVDYFKSDRNYVFGGFHKLLSELREQGKSPVDRDTFIYINSIIPGEANINTIRLLDVDATDVLELTKAEIKGYKQISGILTMLKEYIPGFENCYLSRIYPQLGVRETRRFIGHKYLKLEDVVEGKIPDDTIALGSYKIDIPANTDAETQFSEVEKPYGIPYGCLVCNSINNLMYAGRNISISAEVLGSTRVMPTCMAVGEAAGIAASLAIEKKLTPYQVDPQDIRKILQNHGAILN